MPKKEQAKPIVPAAAPENENAAPVETESPKNEGRGKTNPESAMKENTADENREENQDEASVFPKINTSAGPIFSRAGSVRNESIIAVVCAYAKQTLWNKGLAVYCFTDEAAAKDAVALLAGIEKEDFLAAGMDAEIMVSPDGKNACVWDKAHMETMSVFQIGDVMKKLVIMDNGTPVPASLNGAKPAADTASAQSGPPAAMSQEELKQLADDILQYDGWVTECLGMDEKIVPENRDVVKRLVMAQLMQMDAEKIAYWKDTAGLPFH